YSGDTTIDFSHMGVNIQNVTTQLDKPNLGLRAGNKISYQMQIKTSISQKSGRGEIVDLYPQSDFFSESDLRQTTVRYALTTDKDAPLPSAKRNQMRDSWGDIHQITNGYYAGSNTQVVNSNAFDLGAGMDRKASLYLNMAYAGEGYDCWLYYCDDTT